MGDNKYEISRFPNGKWVVFHDDYGLLCLDCDEKDVQDIIKQYNLSPKDKK